MIVSASIPAMGFRSYRGEVTTVHHVLMKHGCVTITCLAPSCGHTTRRWAYRLWQRKDDVWKLPLEKPVAGFHCTWCRCSGPVILRYAH